MEKLYLLVLTFITIWLSSVKGFTNIETDESALIAFKAYITPDYDHILSKNWTPSSNRSSICYWIGVFCSVENENQRVTSLNVSGFRLSGTIAPDLGNLTFLTSLDISNNNFSGLIPNELSNLQRLQEINVGFNDLSGEIPSWFGNLPQLESIFMNDNTFDGLIPPVLGNNTKLKRLVLSYNMLHGNIPQEIGNLSMLIIVDTKYNVLTGSIPSELFNISSLKSIDLTGNSLTGGLAPDICSNHRLVELQGIFLSANQLHGLIPSTFHLCKELQDLSLSYNQFSGKIPDEIGYITKLKTLYLGINNLIGIILYLFKLYTSQHSYYIKMTVGIACSKNYVSPNSCVLKDRGRARKGQIIYSNVGPFGFFMCLLLHILNPLSENRVGVYIP